MSMKIGFLTRSLIVENGGLDRYSFEVVSRISSKPDTKVTAVVEQASGADYEQVLLSSNHNSILTLFKNVIRVRRTLSSCDVVHALDLYPYGLIAALALIFRSLPLIINGVGTESVVKLSHPLLGPLLKWTYRRAARVLCISEYTKRRILAKAPDLKNLSVVYLGVDTKKFDRPHLSSAGSAPVIVSVGALKRRKGYHVSIAAVSEIAKRYPGMKYYIIGSHSIGKYAEQLKAQVQSLGLDNVVEFLQDLPDEQLIQIYQKADVFVLTSINVGEHFEGYGLVFLEAGMCHLPLVGTTDCGIEEIVKSGISGFLVPQEDVPATSKAIEALLSDPDLRVRMRQASYEFAQAMDWNATVEEYCKAYEYHRAR